MEGGVAAEIAGGADFVDRRALGAAVESEVLVDAAGQREVGGEIEGESVLDGDDAGGGVEAEEGFHVNAGAEVAGEV